MILEMLIVLVAMVLMVVVLMVTKVILVILMVTKVIWVELMVLKCDNRNSGVGKGSDGSVGVYDGVGSADIKAFIVGTGTVC